MIKSFI